MTVDSESSLPPGHLVAERLTKRFGDFTAVSEVSFSVTRGNIDVIIGGSGAGKTTLLKLLVGLEEPSSGRVLIEGVDPSEMRGEARRRLRQKFGMVFQYSALLDSLTVFENVAFPLREHRRLSAKELVGRVDEKLELLGLGGKGALFPSELSGGMRKRVGLARALVLEPEVVFYDEPTSGLDPLTSRKVDDLILETRARFGVTSVVISHDMAGALRIADRIHLLSGGRLEISVTPEALLESEHPVARDFLVESGLDARRLLRERADRRPTYEPHDSSLETKT